MNEDITYQERKWYDDFLSQDELGNWIAWDETQCDAIGYFDSKREAIRALYEYSKKLNKRGQ